MPKSWGASSALERKKILFNNRLKRLNRLVELKAPSVVLFNEAILIAKACIPGNDTSTEALIQILQSKLLKETQDNV